MCSHTAAATALQGNGRTGDVEELLNIGSQMSPHKTICGLSDGAAWAVQVRAREGREARGRGNSNLAWPGLVMCLLSDVCYCLPRPACYCLLQPACYCLPATVCYSLPAATACRGWCATSGLTSRSALRRHPLLLLLLPQRAQSPHRSQCSTQALVSAACRP